MFSVKDLLKGIKAFNKSYEKFWKNWDGGITPQYSKQELIENCTIAIRNMMAKNIGGQDLLQLETSFLQLVNKI